MPNKSKLDEWLEAGGGADQQAFDQNAAVSAEIVEMYKAGMPLMDILDETGWQKSRVVEVICDAGLATADEFGSYMPRTADLFTEAEKQDFLNCYFNEWLTLREIKERFGLVSNAGVYGLLAQLGRKPRTKKRDYTIGKAMQMDHAVELYKQGRPLWRIVEETGVGQPALHQQLHARGVPLRRKTIHRGV